MKDVNCSTCHFYVHGACHSHPPTSTTSGWPLVNEDEWCGEYKADSPVQDAKPSRCPECRSTSICDVNGGGWLCENCKCCSHSILQAMEQQDAKPCAHQPAFNICAGCKHCAAFADSDLSHPACKNCVNGSHREADAAKPDADEAARLPQLMADCSWRIDEVINTNLQVYVRYVAVIAAKDAQIAALRRENEEQRGRIAIERGIAQGACEERDRLAARVAELERERDEERKYTKAQEATTQSRWDEDRARLSAQVDRIIEAERALIKERDKALARVAELERHAHQSSGHEGKLAQDLTLARMELDKALAELAAVKAELAATREDVNRNCEVVTRYREELERAKVVGNATVELVQDCRKMLGLHVGENLSDALRKMVADLAAMTERAETQRRIAEEALKSKSDSDAHWSNAYAESNEERDAARADAARWKERAEKAEAELSEPMSKEQGK